MINKLGIFLITWLFGCVSGLSAEVTFQAIHSASNDVLVAFLTGDSIDMNKINIEDKSL